MINNNKNNNYYNYDKINDYNNITINNKNTKQ